MKQVMGYAALGKARSDWLEPMREYYTKFITPLTSLYTLGEKTGLVRHPLLNTFLLHIDASTFEFVADCCNTINCATKVSCHKQIVWLQKNVLQCLESNALGNEEARDLAATSQVNPFSTLFTTEK